MRKLIILAHVSQDGVIQAPGGPDEDCDGGFEHGGWTVPFMDPMVGDVIEKAHGKALDLVLGRRVYDIWASYWPHQQNPIAGLFNQARKYVLTHRPESLEWGPAEALGPDTGESIRLIKSRNGPNLITWGGSTLIPLLLEKGLADQLILIVYPVLLGKGKRLFGKRYLPCELNLLESQKGNSGVLINRYEPSGSLRTGTFL